jgi:hypothetical protein
MVDRKTSGKAFGLPITWLVTPAAFGALGALVALIYLGVVTPLYEVQGAATIIRSRIESPHMADESTRNRWIWVRDGMTTRNELASDDFFAAHIEGEPLLKARYDAYVQSVGANAAPEADLKLAFARRFSDAVKVEYTGGDSSSYIVTVRDVDRQLAKNLVDALLVRLRELTVAADTALYADAIKALERQLAAVATGADDVKKDRRHYLSDMLSRLTVTAAIDREESDTRFKIVRRPFLPTRPAWPNRWFVFALGVAGGLFVGALIEYARATAKHARR